jgi:AraC-like DNA-binding protein
MSLPPELIESGPPSFLSEQVTSSRRFYLNLRPRNTRTASVVCGGWEHCADDFTINRRSFPYFGLEFVAAGSGHLVLNGKRHRLSPGSVFTYGPGVSHEIRSSHDDRLDKYFVDATGRDTPRLMAESGLTPGTLLQTPAIADVREAFAQLIRLGLRRDARTERTCALQFELLLHTIARSKSVRSKLERQSQATFERCRKFMDEHFLRTRTVEEVAESCHVDASHLCRLFRQFQHDSPLQYLLRRRMNWAAERLANASVLVQEVAHELEVDPFHFSRTFKHVHGVSPSDFLRSRG